MAVVSFTFIRILVQFFERGKAQEKPSRTGAHARIAGYSINPRIYERGPLVLTSLMVYQSLYEV